jgi:hypothetical protein
MIADVVVALIVFGLGGWLGARFGEENRQIHPDVSIVSTCNEQAYGGAVHVAGPRAPRHAGAAG